MINSTSNIFLDIKNILNYTSKFVLIYLNINYSINLFIIISSFGINMNLKRKNSGVFISVQ